MSKSIGILLAAGESSRLGQPKQLLKWKEEPLIVHALSEMQAVCSETWVVLGAHAPKIRQALPPETSILLNENWKNGMGSTIRTGIIKASEQTSAEWVLISLCDQPYLDRAHYSKLMASRNESGVVATSYGKGGGVPALFHRQYWDALIQFNGDAGAKSIINQPNINIPRVEPAGDPSDIDTLEDYKKLIGKSFPH